jgi:hypothetical protein
MPPTPNAIDLTTLNAVKQWSGSVDASGNPQASSAWDQVIQDAITAFSLFMLRRTGRGPQDGSVPPTSSLNSVVTVTETYDGSGTNRQFLRLWPIQSVISLTVGAIAVPSSPSPGSPGYVIDGSKKSLAIVCGGGGYGGPATFADLRGGRRGRGGFWEGIQNVVVNYTAGFDGVPFDLEMLSRRTVALNYKRKGWLGQSSQSMANGAGTVVYTNKEMEADCEHMIQFYKRRAIV